MFIHFRDLKGKKIITKDDSFGRLSDFLLDTRVWQIRYAIIDIDRWLPGRKIVLPPELFVADPITACRIIKPVYLFITTAIFWT
ncbi:MAG: PRC-barrel domain-containing protein [Oligoflexus sp.]